MKIIKPVLLGPKLIAVGPLKCFKGGGSSGGSSGGGSRGGGKGGGGSSSGSSSKGGTGEQSAQQREAQLQTDAMKKKQAEEAAAEKEKQQAEKNKELSMGGQLSGMDFSDITRDPETGKQKGKAKEKDERGFFSKVGDFLETGETDVTAVGEAKERYKDRVIKKGYGAGLTPRELEEYEKDTAHMSLFDKPQPSKWKGQKEQATREGVTDFTYTDQAEVERLEAEEKAAADLEKARELEAKRVEEEVSPFTKQLAGVDLEKAEFAGKMRQTPIEERRKLMQEDIRKEMSDKLKKAQEKRMSFFDKLIGRKPAFQAVRSDPDMQDRMEEKYQLTEDDIGFKEYWKDSGIDTPEAQKRTQEAVQKERDFIKDQKELRELSELDERGRIADETTSPGIRQALDEIKEQQERKRLIEADAPDQTGILQALEQRRLIEADSPDQEGVRDFLKDRAKKEEQERKRLIEADSPDQEGIRDFFKQREREEALKEQMAADPRFGSEEEFKAFKAAQEKQALEKKQMDAGSKLMADWENKVRAKQEEMDRAKGLDVGDGPGLKTKIVDGVKKKVVETAEGTLLDTAGNLIEMIPGVGLVNTLSKAVGGPDLVKKALQKTGVEGAIKSGVSGAVDAVTPGDAEPTSFQEAIEARAAEAEGVEKPAPKPGGDRSSGAGALAALGAGALAAKALQPKAKEPAAPAPAPEPAKGEPTDVEGEKSKLLEDLKKQASGEESLAEKQIRRTQDRSLAQRLAALKSMRGQDSGTKLRSFSKASDKARREAEGQIEIAGMKERRSAQDQLRAQLNKMSDDEMRERWRKIDRDDRQRLMKMNREDAIKRGEFNKWLTVIAMGQKLFPDQIKAAGGFIGDNVLSPVWEGGKKIVKGALGGVGDFIGDIWKAEGGFVSGPGTETSDSIPARLSDGEFVVKSSAVRGLGKVMGGKGKKEQRKKGVDFLYKLQDKMDKAEKFAKGGEAYVRPKKAFREAIGYEAESRFHDKAAKDAKHGGARRKFRHFQQGGPVSLDVKGMKPQFNIPQSQGYGSVVAAQKDLDRRLQELERQLGR